jgi:integrase
MFNRKRSPQDHDTDAALPLDNADAPLQQVLEATIKSRWEGTRGCKTTTCQARQAVRWMEEHGATTVGQVTKALIKGMAADMQAKGLAYETISRRIISLSALGITVGGCFPYKPRKLKWWLRPHQQAELLAWLRDSSPEAVLYVEEPRPDPIHLDHPTRVFGFETLRQHRARLADLIEWTSFTGLRIEESLRVRGTHLFPVQRPDEERVRWELDVPGTKTAGSRATIPISTEAAAIVERLRPAAGEHLFPIRYVYLQRIWRHQCRPFLGVPPEQYSMATLKALRRTAARHLHATKGMPLDMVRQYLRHSDVQTTMGYLQLTGGYDRKEMGKYL